MLRSCHLVSTSCRPEALTLVADSAVSTSLWSFTSRLNTFCFLNFIEDVVEHIEFIVFCFCRLFITCSCRIRSKSETPSTRFRLAFVYEIKVFPSIVLWIPKSRCRYGQIVLPVNIFLHEFRFGYVIKECVELISLNFGRAFSGASSTSLAAVTEWIVSCQRLLAVESLTFIIVYNLTAELVIFSIPRFRQQEKSLVIYRLCQKENRRYHQSAWVA